MTDSKAVVDRLTLRAQRRGFVTLAEVQVAVGSDAEAVAEVNARLEEAGVSVRDVVLPSDGDDGSTARKKPAGDAVRTYLSEIGSVPLLSAEQEVSLAIQIEAGHKATERLAAEASIEPAETLGLEATAQRGDEAHRRMVEANLRLVVNTARRYLGNGLHLLDLVQEGSIGLIRAVEGFDYRRGFRFSTYAIWWIRQSIQRALANQGRTVRVPARLQDELRRMVRVQRKLTQRLGRAPTDEEIATSMELPPDAISELRRVELRPVSLDTPVGENGETTMGELLEDDSAPAPAKVAEAHLVEAYIRHALETLREREQLILEMRFGLSGQRTHTLEEVGGVLGITRERVRQIEARALRKLRHPSRLGAFPELLDG